MRVGEQTVNCVTMEMDLWLLLLLLVNWVRLAWYICMTKYIQ